MKKLTLKILVSLIACSLIIVFVLSSISLSQSKSVMQNEVKKELTQTSQRYANQFTVELQNQENVVDLLNVSAVGQFRVANYQHNRGRFLSQQEKFRIFIEDIMKDMPEVQSLYITFNPKTSGGNDEIWYLRSEEGKATQKKLDNTVKDWLVDNGNETDAYYFDAIRHGTKWSGVEYDKYLNRYSITYSKACRDKDGQLIGVIGVDIFIDHILDSVKKIQLAEGGYAFLIDQKESYITGSSSSAKFDKMKAEGLIPKKETLAGSQNPINTNVNGERFFSTSAVISNGWTLVLIQREEVLLKPIHDMTKIMILLAVLILVGMLVYSYYFFRKSLVPFAREFEEKDIIMLHQSRQARLGEMVGNIAHQWKQPLNVMSIMISLIWDDYHNKTMSERSLKEHLDKMRTAIKGMSGTVDEFADFLKPSRKKEAFSVSLAVNVALDLMQESIKMNRIAVKTKVEEECFSFGYKNEFSQAVFNVLNNARDASKTVNEKREIQIEIYPNHTENPKPMVYVDVINYGSKLSEDVLKNAFQPYFTTKEASGGTGIGLYITKDIIETHMNGSIELVNIENGVLCRIKVPREYRNE